MCVRKPLDPPYGLMRETCPNATHAIVIITATQYESSSIPLETSYHLVKNIERMNGTSPGSYWYLVLDAKLFVTLPISCEKQLALFAL